MVKTFRQFLEEKAALSEVAPPDSQTMLNTLGAILGVQGGGTGGINAVVPRFTKAYPGIAAAIGADPATELAMAKVSAAKKKTQPQQQQQPLNVSALPGTQPMS